AERRQRDRCARCVQDSGTDRKSARRVLFARSIVQRRGRRCRCRPYRTRQGRARRRPRTTAAVRARVSHQAADAAARDRIGRSTGAGEGGRARGRRSRDVDRRQRRRWPAAIRCDDGRVESSRRFDARARHRSQRHADGRTDRRRESEQLMKAALVLLLSSTVAAEPVAVKVADHVVDGSVIKDYSNTWELFGTAPDGSIKRMGTWSDDVKIMHLGKREVIARKQVWNYGTGTESYINFVDHKTLQPIISNYTTTVGFYYRFEYGDDGKTAKYQRTEPKASTPMQQG